jgi:hypothetical protein
MVRANFYVETQEEREESLRRRALDALRDHAGILPSLTREQQAAIAQMDPGPCPGVGRSPDETPPSTEDSKKK